MTSSPHRYFILHKPFDMVSQFIVSHEVRCLADLDIDFPQDIHAIGRLDKDSEGLLILTTNKKVTRLLFQSQTPHQRTYLVQVNHQLSIENLEALRTGVAIKIKAGQFYTTPPCQVNIVDNPEKLYTLEDRLTAYPPYTWILITLTEGKYHQVRKMITAIRHKCKRLIRVSIEDLALGQLPPGALLEIKERDFFEKLKLVKAEDTHIIVETGFELKEEPEYTTLD
ncbi:MAG: rRNA pseudouridine synthase [Saprospiraceae bacterium]|nr:rRNA pseudouridine synthase [Saprospiraceae bacterium]